MVVILQNLEIHSQKLKMFDTLLEIFHRFDFALAFQCHAYIQYKRRKLGQRCADLELCLSVARNTHLYLTTTATIQQPTNTKMYIQLVLKGLNP